MVKLLNFILYEQTKKFQEYTKQMISTRFCQSNDKYQIIVVSKYTREIQEKINNLVGKNIYILDMDTIKSGLELAKKIRTNGDWTSSIILTTKKEELKNKAFDSPILAIAVVKKDKTFFDNMKKALSIALKIQSHHKSFNFVYNNELYQIPHNDILYFEKDLNHNYTSIITKNLVYKIKESIKSIENKLDNPHYFFKTHQSCIVNLKNIKKVNFNQNIIYFKNKEINLLSRYKKKELKERLEIGIE